MLDLSFERKNEIDTLHNKPHRLIRKSTKFEKKQAKPSTLLVTRELCYFRREYYFLLPKKRKNQMITNK